MTKISTVPKQKFQLSSKDRELLLLLQENARESIASLARKLGVSRATVQERIQRLETAEIIEGYSVKINKSKLPPGIDAIVMVLIENKAFKDTLKKLEPIPTIRSIYSLSGEWDWALYISAPTLEEFHHTITALNELEGIRSTVSHIVMETKMDRRQNFNLE